jgi:predicted RNA-binding Zn ribbon-like protein
VSEDTAEGASSSEPLRDARELRRWCQMEDCGTHEKMHRYVARHAAVRKAT